MDDTPSIPLLDLEASFPPIHERTLHPAAPARTPPPELHRRHAEYIMIRHPNPFSVFPRQGTRDTRHGHVARLQDCRRSRASRRERRCRRTTGGNKAWSRFRRLALRQGLDARRGDSGEGKREAAGNGKPSEGGSTARSIFPHQRVPSHDDLLGGTTVAGKLILQDVPPITAGVFRSGATALLLLTLLRRQVPDPRTLGMRDRWTLFWIGAPSSSGTSYSCWEGPPGGPIRTSRRSPCAVSPRSPPWLSGW